MTLVQSLITVPVIAAIVIALLVLSRIVKKVMKSQLGDLLGQVIPVLAVAVAVIGVLLIIDPDQVNTLLDSTISSVPRIMIAVIVVIVARALGRIVGALVETALSRAPVMASRVGMFLSALILGVGVIIALQQVGISTDIILVLVAALAFGSMLAVALAVGLGSVPLAKRVAAGRHVANRFQEGQLVRVAGIEGRLVSIGLASSRIEAMDGGFVEVPNDEFLEEPVVILP